MLAGERVVGDFADKLGRADVPAGARVVGASPTSSAERTAPGR
jgi:hypothetical protein